MQRDHLMTKGPLDTYKNTSHSMTQGHCPTPWTSPTYIAMNVTAVPAKPHQMESGGSSCAKEEHPMDGPPV